MKSLIGVLLLLVTSLAFAGDEYDEKHDGDYGRDKHADKYDHDRHDDHDRYDRDRHHPSDEAVSHDHLLLPQNQGQRGTGVFTSGLIEGGGINRISVLPFYVDHATKLTRAVIHLTNSAPGNAWYCIYDRHKSLEAEAVFSTELGPGDDGDVIVKLTPSPFILRVGWHYLASSADNNVAQASNFFFDVEGMSFLGWIDSAVIADGHCPDHLQSKAFAKYPQSTPWVVLK